MNARERYLAVYDEDERQKLDRVPTFVQGVKGEFMQKHEEEMFDTWEGDLIYDINLDSAIVMGFDATFADVPDNIRCEGAELTDKDGNKHKVGISGKYNDTGSTYYHKGLLYSQENLDELWASIKRVDNSEGIKKQIEHYEKVADKIFPVIKVGGIFDKVWMGMQMKYFARHYRKKTKLYKDIIKYFGDLMIGKIEAIIEATGGRAGIINILDDVAYKGNPMLSPQRFEEDFGEYYTKACKMIRDEGMIAQIHTDGDVTELIPSFQKVGFQGLQGWEGGVDPNDTVKNYPDFVAIGFGDVSYIIPHGTREEIEEHVKELMDALKENRHYIFGPSTVIQGDDPIENVRLFMECGKKYGKY